MSAAARGASPTKRQTPVQPRDLEPTGCRQTGGSSCCWLQASVSGQLSQCDKRGGETLLPGKVHKECLLETASANTSFLTVARSHSVCTDSSLLVHYGRKDVGRGVPPPVIKTDTCYTFHSHDKWFCTYVCKTDILTVYVWTFDIIVLKTVLFLLPAWFIVLFFCSSRFWNFKIRA